MDEGYGKGCAWFVLAIVVFLIASSLGFCDEARDTIYRDDPPSFGPD